MRFTAIAMIALAAVIGPRAWTRLTERRKSDSVRTPAAHPPGGEPYRLADNLYVIPDGGANTAVFIASAGVVVVDPKYPENGAAVVAAIRTLTDKPIVYVINTHCHNDHFGGNLAMPMDVQIVAQENTAANIARLRGTGDPSVFEGRRVLTYRDRLTLFDGEDAVDLYYFGAAHTDGDSLVVFRASGVMHAGDIFDGKVAPIVNLAWGGSPREYGATIARAASTITGVTRVVAGHGAVFDWTDFVNYGEFNRRLLGHVEAEMNAGQDWHHARDSLSLPPAFADYDLSGLAPAIQDMYKGLTPWWQFW